LTDKNHVKPRFSVSPADEKTMHRAGRERAQAAGVKFGRKPKLSDYQRKEALRRRAAGETLTSIAQSYAADVSMISRLKA
jgi:DNA invertase Pin-like site-specific DNA recombinase